MSDRADAVRMDELRQVLRLVNDLRDLPSGSPLQRRHAVEGIARLAGAYVGVWAELRGLQSGRVSLQCALDRGWSDDRSRATFSRYLNDGQPHSVDPSLARLARAASGDVSTFRRQDLLTDDEWYRHAHVMEARRSAGVDAFIYTIRRTGPDTGVAIGLHRPWKDRPFSERERGIVDLIYAETGFLHAQPDLSPLLLRGLSPRLGDTLRGIARGRSDKQIAADLGISPHTVHDYVKALHRHFGVQSRVELLALCLGRN